MVNVVFETAEGEVVATMAVGPDGVEAVDGDAGVIDYNATPVGVHTGKFASYKSDPEEWARSLPRVYRNAYLQAFVIDDDKPYEWCAQEPIVIEARQLAGV